MYWCKLGSFRYFGLPIVVLLAGLGQACKPEIKETGAKLKYFDLKGFFYADSARLTRLNEAVLKTVKHNGISETKKVHIADWGSELGFFIASDINKPAWRDSYQIQETPNSLIYTAKDPQLKTTEIIISQTDHKVKWILIFNHTKNMLYETREKLSYFPDSMYLIEKTQQVRLLGKNRYDIKGIMVRSN